jgi:hypothetical protein
MTPIDLLTINVNDKTEKKNGMTYLSWAWAWTEVLKADPTANFEVKMFPDGTGIGMTPVMSVGETAMVWVTCTVFGKPMTCQLPVLDYRNKPIANPNAMDINTAIMRCLVKAIALHGLGLYIYSGEDMPIEEVKVETKTITVETPTASVEMIVTADAPLPAQVLADGSSVAAVEAPKGEWTADDAKKIGDTMLAFIAVHRDLPDLNSYWKKNQVVLDKLKASHLDVYTAVRNGFAEYKKTLQSKESK